MAEELVRARINGFEKNLSRAFAEATVGVQILDEPTTNPDGTLRGVTRTAGRPVKPRTTVARSAARKRTAKKAASAASTVKENDQ